MSGAPESRSVVYEIEHLHQPGGWLSPGFLTVTDGRITAVAPTAPDGIRIEKCRGFGIPGMPNLHSHAFQRALAGRTESVDRALANDDLFTWREQMYRLVERLSPDQYQAIAEFTYVQLLKGGFTSVCEFHYLHHATGGARYANPAEMSERLLAAASAAGIAITLLPTLYLHGGIGVPAAGAQRRFAHASATEYLALIEALLRSTRDADASMIGIALHSLRAVAPAELAEAVTGATELDPSTRIHVHVSETEQEVIQVRAGLGARPVEWLLDHVGIDKRWTLVHATHLDAHERERLARSGSVAGLCPLTEAMLGDGLFPLVEHSALGGVWGVGTDSHYSAQVAWELRMLECGQRLHRGRRNVLADPSSLLTSHSGRRLFDLALCGGALASGRSAGTLIAGHCADLVMLDPDSPTLLEHDPETVLDGWILGADSNSVRDVMVGGHWVVRDGCHAREQEATRRFAAVLKAGVG